MEVYIIYILNINLAVYKTHTFIILNIKYAVVIIITSKDSFLNFLTSTSFDIYPPPYFYY